jgi:NodT family efflux transporter outer membrane factor (OMF) lipoprotein
MTHTSVRPLIRTIETQAVSLKPSKHFQLSCTTLVCLMTLGLAACSTSPTYVKLELSVPAVFKETPNKPSAAAPSPVPDAWWKVFADPELDRLQYALLANNNDLKNSVAQYLGARATLGASKAVLSPTLGLSAAANRSVNAGGTAASLESLSANASWELDLWGRLAGAVDVSQARLQASQDDVAAARLSLQGSLTQTYFSLRAADAQISVIDKALASYQRALELTQNRYDSGVTSAADVAQAQSQLKSTQAQAIEARSSRAQLEHAVAVLTGQAPAAFTLSVQAVLPSAPEAPGFLPSTLLERRPDIAAAERRVAAAFAQQGVARAAFFPSLSLSANAGYKGSAMADLISAPNLFWTLGPGLALSLIDGGIRRAAEEQASANTDQAVAVYRQAVLVALQEVEDNLVVSQRLDEEQLVLTESLAAANKALAVVSNQYQAGTVSFLNVLTAQTTALSVERNLLDVQYRKLVASAQLLKNLGGRWEAVTP